MSSQHTYIAYAKRTPIGRLSGALASLTAPRMGASLIEDALATTGLSGDQVCEVIMGNVLSAGVGQAPARQAAIYGGLPHSVRALTINRVCGSGLKAVMLADQAIRLSEAHLVLAGGMENMTLAPHMLPNSRTGYKFGQVQLQDHLQYDGLWDPYNEVAMGHCGDLCAKEYGFSREDQDAFASESYAKARKAAEEGAFKNEILSLDIKHRKATTQVDQDEEPFAVDLEKLPRLRPAFNKDGTVTAGNASPINDGAALVVLSSEKSLELNRLQPLARIRAQSSYAHEPAKFTTAPIPCIKQVVDKAGWQLSDVDLFEINEAFAVVAMAAQKELAIPTEKLNVHGGAVALGHPIGASGCRILVTLIHALKSKNLKRGVAAICIGGGEASAVAVELV